MANYIETLGACEYDNLIAGNTIPTHTATGTIASGQGKLARGTVLALSTGTSGTNKLVILGTTAGGNETLTAYGILCDEVDATSADAGRNLCYRPVQYQPADRQGRVHHDHCGRSGSQRWRHLHREFRHSPRA